MPSLRDHRQQACLGQLGEMRAGGLGRNSRRKGKLAGRQGATIEKRCEHRRSCRLPDQRRYFGNERACNHLAYVTPVRCVGQTNSSTVIEARFPPVRHRSSVAASI